MGSSLRGRTTGPANRVYTLHVHAVPSMHVAALYICTVLLRNHLVAAYLHLIGAASVRAADELGMGGL